VSRCPKIASDATPSCPPRRARAAGPESRCDQRRSVTPVGDGVAEVRRWRCDWAACGSTGRACLRSPIPGSGPGEQHSQRDARSESTPPCSRFPANCQSGVKSTFEIPDCEQRGRWTSAKMSMARRKRAGSGEPSGTSKLQKSRRALRAVWLLTMARLSGMTALTIPLTQFGNTPSPIRSTT